MTTQPAPRTTWTDEEKASLRERVAGALNEAEPKIRRLYTESGPEAAADYVFDLERVADAVTETITSFEPPELEAIAGILLACVTVNEIEAAAELDGEIAQPGS